MSLTADESMATLAEFRTYATARQWPEASAGVAPDADVESWLRQGTDYLVATVTWPGTLAVDTQVSPWPRTGAKDREGRTLTGTPLCVKAATIEAARLAQDGALMGGAAASEAQLIRKKTGPLEKEWAPQSNAQVRQQKLAWVLTLLAPIRAYSSAASGSIDVFRA